ncbi:MAG: acetyltransferase, partial [bacterium]|nr:acetyltransferase [bacterium]
MCLFGASGHAKVIIDILERMGRYHIHGLFDDNQALWGQALLGYTILGGKAAMKGLQAALIVSIGNNRIRSRLAAEFKQQSASFATAIHPGASISRDVRIDAGSVVMAGVVLNADTRIHEHVIVNTSASVDHDCIIEDAVHIAPGAHLCGGVSVGKRVFIGAGATIIPNINIGRDAVIGAGATVICDIPD